MADYEKAVAVAQDVLAWLALPETRGKVLTGSYLWARVPGPIDPLADLRTYAEQAMASGDCEVCMLGACLLSKAKLFDAVPVKPFAGHSDGRIRAHGGARDDVTEALEDVFDRETMDLMESAFERTMMGWTADRDLMRGAATFGMGFLDPRDRARAIMENVVAHGGKFVVEPVSAEDYAWDDEDDDFDDGEDFDEDDEDDYDDDSDDDEDLD